MSEPKILESLRIALEEADESMSMDRAYALADTVRELLDEHLPKLRAALELAEGTLVSDEVFDRDVKDYRAFADAVIALGIYEQEEDTDARDHEETGPAGDARSYDPETGEKLG